MAQRNQWSSNLCDCSPCDACLLGTCLPCVLLGRTADRIRDPTGQTHDAFNGDCAIWCGIQFFTGCGWIYAMMKRGEIREMYNIEGSGTSDCCVSYWCSCCALIQQDKEVASRQASGQAPVTVGYQAQKGMQMPLQQHQPQQQQPIQQHPQQHHQSFSSQPHPQHQQSFQSQQGYQQTQQPQHPQQTYSFQQPGTPQHTGVNPTGSPPPPQYAYQQQQQQPGYESHGIQQAPLQQQYQQGYPQEKS